MEERRDRWTTYCIYAAFARGAGICGVRIETASKVSHRRRGKLFTKNVYKVEKKSNSGDSFLNYQWVSELLKK